MIDGIEDYEIRYWINSFGSMPVKLVKSIDANANYNILRAKVFELASFKNAL